MNSFYRKYIKDNKLTPLNVSGMVLGMFTFMFIYFYVFTESNYDQFLENSDHIYHLTLDIKRNGEDLLYSNTPLRLGEEVYNEVPGIKNWATFTSIDETAVLKEGNNKYLNPEIIYVNSGFFNVFSYTCVQGDLSQALANQGTAVITESAALKYFGTTDIIGREYELLHKNREKQLVAIQAVIKDLPENSNIQCEIFGNIDDFLDLVGERFADWYFKTSQSYIELEDNTQIAALLSLMDEVVDKRMNNHTNPTADIVHIGMEQIREKHFKKNYTLMHSSERFITKNSVIILMSVGVLTLLISWLNYINFMIFQTGKYLHEVCIRKINGSGRMRIFWFLLKDTLLLSLIPVIITIGLFLLFAPGLYQFFNFNAENIQVNSLNFWLSLISFFIIGSVLASALPLIKVTSAQPIQLLNNSKGSKNNFKRHTQIFTVLQFSLSIVMLIGVGVIYNQMLFMHSQKLGFNKDNVLSLASPVAANLADYEGKIELFKKEALKNPNINAVSATSSIPGERITTMDFGLIGKQESMNKRFIIYTDEDYFKTLGVNIIAGYNFSSNPKIRNQEVIINRTLAQALGFDKPEDAIGKLVRYPDASIAGVVEDYHHFSPHQGIKPILYNYNSNAINSILVRLNTTNLNRNIDELKTLWNNIFTNTPFEYEFVDDGFKQQYANEDRLIKVTFVFTLIAIIITILGIIGTSLNMTSMRIKEIGIHKVNGAKVMEVMVLLNADYVKSIILAFLIAGPIAYFSMSEWLTNFAYKSTISWWIFALAGLLALGIALLTASWQSWRAATRNPVEALRYE